MSQVGVDSRADESLKFHPCKDRTGWSFGCGASIGEDPEINLDF
jgi:hypothetical protein